MFDVACSRNLMKYLFWNLQLAWIMSGFIPNFYIPMQPVISGLLEVKLLNGFCEYDYDSY